MGIAKQLHGSSQLAKHVILGADLNESGSRSMKPSGVAMVGAGLKDGQQQGAFEMHPAALDAATHTAAALASREDAGAPSD